MNVLAITFGACSVILSYALVRVSLRLKSKSKVTKKYRHDALIARKMQILSEIEKEDLQKQLGIRNVFEPNFGMVSHE